jgi:U4/U6 small nuclear ribonucleoprotein PRP31
LRVRVARAVSCKVTLAARVDSFHESSTGKTGKFLLSEIERRIEKLQEPPPVKAIKPLAPPIDPGRKKRGGRRARKMKERLGMTEMSKQQNRMIFGEVCRSVAVGRVSTGVFGARSD